VKQNSHKGTESILLHSYEVSRIVKFIQSRVVVPTVRERRVGSCLKGPGVHNMSGVLELDVTMTAQ
jgi:hypothetical protein